MSDPVEELKTALAETQQPKTPLRARQRQDWEDERRRLEAVRSAPSYVGADRGAAQARLRTLDTMLNAQTPKPLGRDQDRVAKLADQVMDTVIKPSLLSRSTLRRNPAGAIDAYNRGENSRAVKTAILTWKRARLALDPQSEAQDVASVEPFRDEGAPQGAATFMAGAQIPGHLAMTPAAKRNWPLGEATAETALKQAQRRELTPADRKAIGKRLAAGRAAKKAREA